ncbi:hypothetical protein CGSMWGv1500E_04571 [Gardnerella vaginalis 1500E]|uniref:Uncharacterized protein n=1 Tax=Gardnerella vaginalis 1500E TaxID=698957 RepID=I4LZR1_GARVA|nr:hypothetical protein CGSMWGv1500E_04571 [Gardnerella vaginalis 1500E]
MRDDLPERCDLAREGNSERRACSRLKARGAFNASSVASALPARAFLRRFILKRC